MRTIKKPGDPPGFLLQAKTPAPRRSTFRSRAPSAHARADERIAELRQLRAALDEAFEAALGKISLQPDDVFQGARTEQGARGRARVLERRMSIFRRFLADRFQRDAQRGVGIHRGFDRIAAEFHEIRITLPRRQRRIRASIGGDLGHGRFRT